MERLLAGALFVVMTLAALTDALAAPTQKDAYPWKTNIAATVFWMEKSGFDYGMPVIRIGSPPPGTNPYYVALPFNDLKYPDLARRWLPAGWQRSFVNQRITSRCKGRWIEIKTEGGRICYAQWEDVGPLVEDDAPYVFGAERPQAQNGLDVSPAVAKRLGIEGSAILSWRFVDDEDVQRGPWLDRDGGQTLLASPGL